MVQCKFSCSRNNLVLSFEILMPLYRVLILKSSDKTFVVFISDSPSSEGGDAVSTNSIKTLILLTSYCTFLLMQVLRIWWWIRTPTFDQSFSLFCFDSMFDSVLCVKL